MKGCWFHDWSKWTYFEVNMRITKWVQGMKEPVAADSVEPWQKRTCNKCGYEQREKL